MEDNENNKPQEQPQDTKRSEHLSALVSIASSASLEDIDRAMAALLHSPTSLPAAAPDAVLEPVKPPRKEHRPDPIRRAMLAALEDEYTGVSEAALHAKVRKSGRAGISHNIDESQIKRRLSQNTNLFFRQEDGTWILKKHLQRLPK